MKLIGLFIKWIKNTLRGTRQRAPTVEEGWPNISSKEIKPHHATTNETEYKGEPVIAKEKDPELVEVVENTTSLPISKEIFQTYKTDLNTCRPFLPNWGDLDPTASLVSNGRKEIQRLTYQVDDFFRKYGHLTTDLGYGIIYSIIMNAVENEDRDINSAFKEASVRSGDPFLCIAIVRDYCARRAIQYRTFARITDEIIKTREKYYTPSGGASRTPQIDLPSLPSLPIDEQQALNKIAWLFNGTILEIYPHPKHKKAPLHLIVKIPSLKDAQIIREFNKGRRWMDRQNVVVQWDGEEDFRILDFK